MTGYLRIACAGLFLPVLGWVAWQTVVTTRIDAVAAIDEGAALRIDPDHPVALRRTAWRQLDRGDVAAATATARRLLTVEPGQGDAFAVLALAAARSDAPDTGALVAIGLRRAPRNRNLRVQRATEALESGNIHAALEQLDILLRLAPERSVQLLPAMVQQAANPAFANALVAILATSPPWRPGFLAALDSKGTPAALNQVNAGLQRRRQLTPAEAGAWYDRLIADGRWGQAYAYWAGDIGASGGSLAVVHDGGFERDPSGIGFGWRNRTVAGVFTDLEPTTGAGGTRAAHLHFMGRPAEGGNLRQALLLAPGHYRLSMRAKAEFLDSDQGLQWIIRCPTGEPVGVLGPLKGNFGWRGLSADFEVPSEGCPGQWLELRNPAVRGSAQQVSGDLWVDDIVIAPPHNPPGS